MKRNKFRGLWYIPVMTFVVSLSACLGSGDETIVLEEGKPAHGIPSDDDADPNPEIGTSTTYIPNVNYTVENTRVGNMTDFGYDRNTGSGLL